jgi:AraC family transcriptional regulator
MTPSNASRAEYTKRMHRVLEHIDSHLDESLELDSLAGVAHFSAFHFHRLFSAWMGETLGDYLRRRRLEVAALRLIAQPRVPVLSIALSVGFGSTEAFARAFKTRFGCTATGWREREAKRRADARSQLDHAASSEDSNHYQSVRKLDQATQSRSDDHEASYRASEVSMKVKVIERQPVRVAYMRHVGPYGEQIADFWMNVVAPWMEANDLFGRPRYGISHDEPGITAPEQCRYDACVEVPPDFVATGQAQITTIPGGKYAATRFRGTSAQIGEAWASMLRDWLPESGMQLDARPSFEYYPIDVAYDPKTGVFECDIMIPVMPL